MNTKYALSVIDTLREGWYNPPSEYYRKKADFIYQSYKRTAMDEIKFYLMEHQDEDPIEALDGFRNLMICFSCKQRNDNMFSVYYDVATDVLDALLGMR